MGYQISSATLKKTGTIIEKWCFGKGKNAKFGTKVIYGENTPMKNLGFESMKKRPCGEGTLFTFNLDSGQTFSLSKQNDGSYSMCFPKGTDFRAVDGGSFTETLKKVINSLKITKPLI